MKAILVIDVNDDINFEEARANIKMVEDNWGLLLGNAKKKWYDNVRLKPMPRKEKGRYWHNTIAEKNTYVCGWNDCIDEILGEQE